MAIEASKPINTMWLIPRLLAVAVVINLVWVTQMMYLFNRARGFDALGWLPFIYGSAIVLLVVLLKRVAQLTYPAIGISIVVMTAIWVTVNTILQPSLYSGDGSTLVGANLFVPDLMWDNDVEYLRIYPVTYIISLAYNYTLFIGAVLMGTRISSFIRR